MNKVLLLTRRELSANFVSPIAYVAMAMFLVISGIFFAMSFDAGKPAQLQNIFYIVSFILLLVVPALTMRSLAEERGSGTIESLLTAPVTDAQVVAAKFLGCWLFYLAILAPTLLYVLVLAIYSRPDYGPILAGYLGLILLADHATQPQAPRRQVSSVRWAQRQPQIAHQHQPLHLP